jgi:Flp pilus assembly protein TadD
MIVDIAAIQNLIEQRRFAAAVNVAREALKSDSQQVELWLLLCLAEQRLHHYVAMREAAEQAALLRPKAVAVTTKLIEAQLLCGQGAAARAKLAELESRAQQDKALLTRLAELYTEAGDHEARLRCTSQALTLATGDHVLLANAAAAETACGNIAAAERNLNLLLTKFPGDCGAYYRRSTLRRQTPINNHVLQLERQLRDHLNTAAEIPLCYALAKEHEDLNQFEQAFDYLARGATQRRKRMAYSVAEDEQVFQAIIEHFDTALLQHVGAVGASDSEPIFVMGLPRSGTTLVDRILSSHSAVTSLGEINDLAYAILRQVHQGVNEPVNKLQLVAASARLDYGRLGRDYLDRIFGYGRSAPMLIDKTPWNFLYVGLIALALPNAHIIHVRRDPMDSCFALYKTLFRGGSPYSYDLNDLARYYLAYDRLMQHWRGVLPDRYFEVSYEQLVQSQSEVTHQLLAYCGLEFEPACLEFYRNETPAATASAAQVREPIHSRSVGNWQHYARQLQPLMNALRAGGVAINPI